jgi:hypothetical protein
MHRFAIAILCATMTLSGCGTPAFQPVRGVVTLDGKPLPNCKVGFFPDVAEFKPDYHGFAFGMTNDMGEYEALHPKGDKGIFSGKYKVFFVAWVDGKGKAVPPESKPSEVPGGVKNLVPAKYETPETTPITASIGGGGGTFNFDLSSKN